MQNKASRAVLFRRRQEKAPRFGAFALSRLELSHAQTCAPQTTMVPQTLKRARPADCLRFIESTRPLHGAGEVESNMRVASLESVLMAATLVSAAVVVLWGLKILFGT